MRAMRTTSSFRKAWVSGTATQARRGYCAQRMAHAWSEWRRLESFLQTGQVCVIDGANGTEIQNVGQKVIRFQGVDCSGIDQVEGITWRS